MDTDTPAAQPSSSEAPSADVPLSVDLDVNQVSTARLTIFLVVVSVMQ